MKARIMLVFTFAAALGAGAAENLTYTLGSPRPATVDNTSDPASNAWLASNAVFVADAAPSKTFITTGATETGYRTIFVKRSDDAQHFYKVQVE